MKLCQISVAAIWLVAIAAEEESHLVPEVLNEMDLYFDSVHGYSNEMLHEVTLRFMEKIKKVKFQATLENAQQVALECIERIKKIYFHGTHIHHVESICKHGLSVEYSNDDPQAERLHRLATEVLNENMVFGYRYTNCVKEEKGQKKKFVYVSTSPYNAIDYAVSSPEWFSIFINRAAYLSRNKEQAKQGLEERLAKWQKGGERKTRAFTKEEAQAFSAYFEKQWENYQEFKPTVFKASLPNRYLISTDCLLQEVLKMNEEVNSLFRKEIITPIEAMRRAIATFIGNHLHAIDVSLDATVPPSQLHPFFLPPEMIRLAKENKLNFFPQ